MAELDLTQDKLDAVMTDPVTGRYNDIFSALLEREKQVRDSRTLGQRAADRFYIEDAEGNPVPKYSESMVEEDPRVQELRQMRREFKREQDKANSWFKGDRIIDLLRGAGDAVFGEDLMSQLPQLSRAIENANMLGRGNTVNLDFEEANLVGMDEPYDSSSFSMRLSKAPGLEEQVESGLSYAGVSPEAAGLGALAAGAMKGRGKGLFDMLGEALDPSTIRKYDDSEDVLGNLRRDRDQEWWDSPEADKLIRKDEWERKRKMRNDPEIADELAKGGRPGTRRRRRMMVPASYKTGGHVFQKGYYGKTYK